MSENENTQVFKMQFIDKFIVSLIFILSMLAIVLTFVTVNAKYKKIYEKQLEQFIEIPYNETYKYLIKDNVMTFYIKNKEAGEYKCSNECKVTDFLSNQFIIDSDDIIPIADGNQVVLYNIKKSNNSISLNEVPKTSINNKYGIVKQNNKYGVINKQGKIVLACNYDDVDINTTHIVALNGNILNVFNNSVVTLFSQEISVTGDISISEKNNYLYINILGNSATTLIYDTSTNTLVN